MENKNYVVAVDLGTNSVVVMVGSMGVDSKVHIEDFVIKESQGVIRGEIKNIELVAKSIKEAIDEVEEKLGIKITETYTGISGQHIKCAKNSYYVYVGRDGEIREENVRQLTDSMRNVQAPDGEKILHIIPQNYIVDEDEEVANPVGMFGQKLEATFNFILGDNNIVSRHEKALNKLDIRQKKMFLNPLVMAEAVATPDEKELGVAIVDIGAGTTDVCIYYDNIIRHIGVIPIGADSINKDIRSYGILERYVEELKVKYGCAIADSVSDERLIKVPGRTQREPKEISFKNLATIIEARMLDIADYVMEEIALAGYEGKLAAGLVLTGGCAGLKDIDLLFKNHTGQYVRIAAPDMCVDDESAQIAARPQLATVVGIIVKALEEEKPESSKATKSPETPRVNAPRFFAPKKDEKKSEPVVAPKPEQVKPVKPTKPVVPDTDDIDDGDLDDKPKGDKKGWLKKMVGKLTDSFDVIDDDNEI